jgi:uncharacterized membrane protein HdeD (DUF308 family)
MIANILSRAWWMILLRAVIAILFGILIFAQPAISLVSLVWAFGVLVLADGVANVVMAVQGKNENDHWWVFLLGGLAGVLVGILALSNPAVTAVVLLFYIAIWAMITGFLQIGAAIRLRKEIQGEFWLFLGGVASVVFGMLLVARPGEGAMAVLWLIGAYALVFGFTLLLLALRVRGFTKRVRGAVTA